MKGGFFSHLAVILLLQKETGGTEVSVEFYNKELGEWRYVQISKEVDTQGNSFGRFVAVF